MIRWLKKIGIGIGIFLGLTLLLMTGLWSYLCTDQAQRFIQRKINRTIPGTLSWETARLSFFGAKAELRNIRLRDPSDNLLISADRVFADIAWSGLFGGALKVESAALEKPCIWLKTDKQGKLNLSAAFPPSEPEPDRPPPKPASAGLPFNIIVDDFRLTDGLAEYETEAASPDDKNRQSALHNIQLTIANADLSARSGQITFEIGKGKADVAGVKTPLDRFRLAATLDKGRVAPLEVKLDSDVATVDISGDVDEISPDPRLQLDLNLDTSLAEIRDAFGLAPELTGPVQLSLNAHGRAADPEVTLKLNYGGGQIAGNRLDRLDLDCHLTGRELTINQLDTDSPFGALRLTGAADLRKAFADGFLSAPTELDAIAYRLSVRQTDTTLEQLPPEGTGLSGAVSSTLSVEGSGISPDTLSAKAVLALQVRKGAVDQVLRPVDLDVNAEAALEKGRVTLRKLDAETGETRLQATGGYTLATGEVSGQVALDLADLGKALSPLGITDLAGKAALKTDISGSVKQPAVTAHITGEKLGFQEIAIGNVRSEIRLDRSGLLTIARLTLQNKGSAIEGSGTIGLLDEKMGVRPGLPADLSLSFKNIRANDFLNKEIVAGTTDGELTLTGPLLAPKAALTLQGKALAVEDTRIGDLAARLRFAAGTATLEQIRLRNNRSDLTLSGMAKVTAPDTLTPLANPEFDLTIGDGTLFLDDFVKTLRGKLVLGARITGSLSAPTATLSLTGKGVAAGENRIGDLTAAVRFADGAATLEQVRLRNNRSGLDISGTARVLEPDALKPLTDPKLDLTLSNGTLFLDDFVKTLKGKLMLAARITGSLSSPTATLSLTGEGVTAGKNRIGDVTAAVQFEDGTARLERVSIRNGKSALNLSGTAKVLNPRTRQPLKDPALDLTIAGDRLFLGDFLSEMKGKLALNGRIQGSVAHPEGHLALEGKNLDLGMQKIDGVRLISRLDGEKVNIETLDIALTPGETLQAKGWIWPLRKTYDLRVKSEGLSLKQIGPIRNTFDDGKIRIDLAGQGRFDDPQLTGDLRLSNLRIEKKRLKDIHVRLDLRDQVARFSGNSEIDLAGWLDLRKKDFSATLRFDQTDLTSYLSLAGLKDLSGVISGTIEARGNTGAIDKALIVADVSQLEIFRDQTELIRARDFKASLQNREISIPDIRLALLKQGHLHIRGGGPLDGPLELNADGNIPLQVLRPFNEALQDIEGDLNLAATLKGSPDQPDLRADLRLKNVGMTIPGLLQKLHGLSGTIHLTHEAVTLKELRGQMDGGSFDLSGQADLKQFRPVRVLATLNAHQLPVQVPDTLDLLLNTQLVLEGTPEKSAVKGEVVLLEGRYYKDIKMNLLGAIGKKKREESPVSSEPEMPFLKNMALNITLRYRQPFLVDNNMALMALRPDLKIQGKVSQPLVSGRAEVESGTVVYQKREFEIGKGVIDFINPYKIEPTIDVDGQAEIRKWTIFLNVSGTPENLKFKLTSDPEEEADDILSLLALGKTTGELIKGEGGESSSVKEILANMVAEDLGKRVKDATGLDILEMKYTEGTAAEDSDEINVTVGKELSRRVTVKYGMDTKDGETVQRAITEYKFLENLLMSAFQDTEGNFGGELQFRLEFR